jgi:outer membrane lipoprotein SlyB
MRTSTVIFSTLILTAFSVSGCATRSSVAKAKDEAHDAHRVAEQALTTAQEANNRSIRTEEMVNRSFRHSMRK